MPKEKEKLLQIGLDDLGRFAIGQESNALYFDDLKVQNALVAAGDEKLKREIGEIVREVVSPRFDNIESLLKEILGRLTSARREVAVAATADLKPRLHNVESLLGQIRNRLISEHRAAAAAAKAKRKAFRRDTAPKK